MAYNPTNWATGDVVTAAKLNKAEEGIKNAYIFPANVKFIKFTHVEHYDEETDESTYEVVSDLTPAEFYAAVENGDRFIGILTFSYIPTCVVMNYSSNNFNGYEINVTSKPVDIFAHSISSLNDDEWDYHFYPED